MRREAWVLGGIALATLLAIPFTAQPLWVLVAGLACYLLITLRNLRRLHAWLDTPGHKQVPEVHGRWGEVFDGIRRLQKLAERREDRLAGALQRFQNAAAAMPDAVVILSEHDEIQWSNPSAAQLLGTRFPRDAGMRVGNLIRHPEFARYFERGEFSELLELPSPSDPGCVVALQVIPFGEREKLVLARDVTRLARLERMRRTFVANVSHELRTPLTVLAGYLETLRDMALPRAPELAPHLATMHDQTARMQRLVDDLLTLSRLETAPPQRHDATVDVPALLAALVEQAGQLSGAGRHRITLEADTALKLLGSHEELHSVFSNLINNAVRYTPAGGSIRLSWQADAQGAHLAIADTGEGIGPEHLPHLTERFYRVDTARSRASGGTGLGLSIVKHALARHDARLQIESEPGRGSVFTCLFPPARVVRDSAPTPGAGT